jgi:hypothetical protein
MSAMDDQSFLEIIAKLEVWQKETIEALRRSPGDQTLLRLKLDLGTAAGCLRLCQKYGIDGRWQPIELPVSDNVYSEARLMWDNETENREHWETVVINGERLGAWPGDVLLCRPPTRQRTK